jgi:hypothetical protein
MDFTYLIAGFVAIIVGVGGSVIFIIKRDRSFRLLLAWLIAVTVVIDFMLLVDWSHADSMTANLLLTDFAFFTLYALIGCPIGAVPVVAGRALYRKLRASRR